MADRRNELSTCQSTGGRGQARRARPGGARPAGGARRLLQRGRRLRRSRRRTAVGLSARPARISARFDQAPMAHPQHRCGVLGLRRVDDVDQDAALYVDGSHSDRPQRRQDRRERQRHAGRRTGTRVHADPIRALAEPYHRRARGLGSQAGRGPRLLRAERILADPLPARPRPLERRARREEQQSQLRGRGGGRRHGQPRHKADRRLATGRHHLLRSRSGAGATCSGGLRRRVHRFEFGQALRSQLLRQGLPGGPARAIEAASGAVGTGAARLRRKARDRSDQRQGVHRRGQPRQRQCRHERAGDRTDQKRTTVPAARRGERHQPAAAAFQPRHRGIAHQAQRTGDGLSAETRDLQAQLSGHGPDQQSDRRYRSAARDRGQDPQGILQGGVPVVVESRKTKCASGSSA